ncbi:ATP-binding protein [Rhizobium sp. CECT 9324]|uniref:ATP-binding protein n=1 Tax=Rhizobium sp. CECT 9324 TaxID=2845820 RepID=UPI001E619723|nr:ATP-binding protein [Rhizobium sp. CECT 9324]CAH0340857.1 Adaptive-response sensory-kinase SasA [Rhizobium sp. CECT 9324]
MATTQHLIGREPQNDIDAFTAQLLDAATESVIVYDLAGRVIFWNQMSEVLYGFARVDALQKDKQHLFGSAASEPDFKQWQTRKTWRGEVQRETLDGRTISVELRIHPLNGLGGTISAFVEYGRVSDFRASEHQTSTSADEEWSALWIVDVSVALASLGQIERNTDLCVTPVPTSSLNCEHMQVSDLNVTAIKLFANGEPLSTALGKSVYWYWPPEHRDALLEMTVSALTTAKEEASSFTRVVGTDTLKVWRDLTSQANHVLSSVSRCRQEADTYSDIAASEQTYRNLIDNIPLPVWQVDARVMTGVIGRLKAAGVEDIADHIANHPDLIAFASGAVIVTDVNDSAVRLFRGASRNDFLRDVSYLFAGTPGAATRLVAAHFEGRRNFSEEIKILAFDGAVLDVLFYVTFPQYPEKLDKTLIMMIDVTEQRHVERQLRKTEADFAHAARVSALGELVTSIAHEVRQPLSVIVTDADTGLRWLDRVEPNIPKVKSIISRIMDNAHRANEVIRRIKDMAVKRDPVRCATDINEIVREASLLVRSESHAHNIPITTRLTDGIPTVMGDRVQLQQVVVNLLINSIQAITMNNPPWRDISIETSRNESGHVLLCVRDTGGGIPLEYIDQIFDGFFSRKTDGMGMGLAICRSIAVDHGGSITVRNDGTRGAVFLMTLPVLNGGSGTDEHPDPLLFLDR